MRNFASHPSRLILPLAFMLLAASVLTGARQCLAYTDPVRPGQTVTGETLGEWCDQWVFGTANYTSITIGGVQYVYSGGVTNYTTIAGGGQTVKSGGVANYTTLNGAIVNVEDGGVINHTTNNGGDLSVYSGGASNYTVINGGIEYVYSGATSNYATISGGMQIVYGTVNYATLNSGTQYVTSGGLANTTTINGGTQNVGGSTANTTTINGGVQNVNSGGTANTTTINGGVQNVNSGGTANTTTINVGGWQNVNTGGTANYTTINTGGWQYVYSGGTANTTTIAGGTQDVRSGGTANDTTIDSGAQSVSGTANSTIINNGGTQNVQSGGTADTTTINNGGTQNVNSGGTANNTTINGGTQNVLSGGTANSTTIAGGTQNVRFGGTANTTTINSGTQNVYGTAATTTINGGTQNVQSGGTANLTTISAGMQNVLSEGTTSNVTMNAGGTLVLYNGGALTDPALENPGTLTFNTTGGQRTSALVVTDSSGTGRTTVAGTGGVTLTGDITQGRGVVVQGGSLTMHDNTLSVSGAASLTFDAAANQAAASLKGVTLDMAAGQNVFSVSSSSNAGNALSLTDMTVDAGSGNGTLLNVSGGSAMAFSASNSTLTGRIAYDATSTGSLSLLSDTTLTGQVTGSPNMRIDSDSQWIMTGNSSLGTLTLAGNVISQNSGTPFTPKTLTVTGVTGAQGLGGGTITLNSVLGNSASPTDKIVVNGGTVTGTTKLFINNVGGLGASTAGTNGILLVQAQNGANTAASLVNPGFYLINSPLNVGAYTYSLRPGDLLGTGQNWYLTTDYVAPMTFAYASSSAPSATSSPPPTATISGWPISLSGSGSNTVAVSGVSVPSTGWTWAGALIQANGATSSGNTVVFGNVTATAPSGRLLISGTGGSTLTFSASGSTLTGDIVFDSSSHANISLTGGTLLTGKIDPVDLAIDSSSKWLMTANSALGSLTLAGNVVSQAASGTFTPKTLTVTNLIGRNGAITLNTYLGGDGSPSDMLVVDGGTVTGATRLAINNVGGLGAQTVGNGILVVQAVNGADTTAQSSRTGFALSAPVLAGSYMYSLRPGDMFGQGQNWYLSSTASGLGGTGRTAYRRDDALLASEIGLSHELMETTLATFHVREGDSVEKASGPGVTVWSRGLGSLVRREGGGTVSPGFEGYTDGFQLGAGLTRLGASGDTSTLGAYGAMVYGNARGWGDSNGARFTHVGQLDMTAYSAGLYGTYQWPGKAYLDATVQGSIQNGNSYGTSNVKVHGYGWSASLAGGYPVALGHSGFSLEPQAQSIYQQAHLGGVSLGETRADLKGGSRLTLRGGARLAYDTTTKTGVRWTPSLSLGLKRTEDANAKVTMSTPSASTSLPSNFSGTALELVAGCTVRIRDSLSIYGQAGYSAPIDGKSSYGAQGSVGLKMTF